ncbi:MAG: magnesium transporter [Candidatus Odinarchaeota archaeon]
MTEQTVRKIILESLPILVIVLVFALAAGQFLDSTLEGLKLIFPLILLMVPAFIDVTGDLAGVVGARVTSHLYTGELDRGFRPYRLLFTNLLAILLVSASAYAFLGVCVIAITIWLSPIIGTIFPPTGFPLLFLAICGAGVMATACTSIIGLFSARMVYRSGRDPDSIIPPLTTTVGDLLGIVFIALAIISTGKILGLI